ncbi:MAG: DAK2 domain-containing protein [Coprobacillus sp.]|nr:DAK2 domain-containing protein [Coprobacillus sp.]
MKTIDGQQLKFMLISGANNLYNHYPEIDALNVFPVPDGDTGMNMNLTLSSGIAEIANRSDTSCSQIMKTFARGLLMGARGNSGVITSQIFNGFAKGVGDKEEISIQDFLDCWRSAVNEAYHVVKNPVEGTILTVVREATQHFGDNYSDNMSFKKAMDLLSEEAWASLDRTPDLLPILKEVGVVDSGSEGLCRVLDGMKSALDGVVIQRDDEATIRNLESNQVKAGATMEDEEFGYCTEFILQLGSIEEGKKKFNGAQFNNYLEAHGGSIVYVEQDDIVKVHIHTLKPGDVLSHAQQYGEFLKIKVDNMTQQHHTMIVDDETPSATAAREAGSAPVKEEKEETDQIVTNRKYAIVAVSSGAGLDEYLKEAGVNVIVNGGQTMNPSAEDILKAIKKAKAENVYILPNNSNIVMSASQAAEMVDNNKVHVYVIPSNSIPQGLVSAFSFSEGDSPEANFKAMKAALKSVKSGEITYSIRDTELDGVKSKKGDYIGMTGKKLISSKTDKIEVLKDLIHSMVDSNSTIISIFLGKDITEEEKETLNDIIDSEFAETYPDAEFDLIDGGQPVYSFLVGVES